MLKSQMIGILVVAGLVSCQKGGSSGGVAGPNVEADKKDEGTKGGSTDDGSEIAIVNLTGDLGACNSSRRGKSYYVLAEKKFRYCGDSDQWDVIDLKGSDGTGGAAGKNSVVLVTPEAAGANCATGGQKIQNGLDQNANSQLDSSEVTATSYACNGLAGSSGASGTGGKPSLVAVTAEAAGSNCATGGNKVRSGLDANGSGALDEAEVQSTSFVCNGHVGAQGVVGAAGTSGKNALVKSSVESAGVNCATGGRKIDFGNDNDGDGVLAVGEVSGSTYVCNGATGASGNDGADGDRYVGRILYTSGGTRLGEIIKEFDYLPENGPPSSAATWTTPSRIFIMRDTATNYDVGYLASSFSNLTIPSPFTPGANSTVHFRSRNYEELPLTKLAPYHSAIVYSNSTCNVSGALFAYDMQSSYIRTGACNGSCLRMFKNKVLHDYLKAAGLNIAYNFSSTQDIVPNWASPVSASLNSHGVTASCETIWNNNDVSTNIPASGQVCPVSFVTHVFPDSIAAGWSVQRN
jgi:hypothetical protein